MPGQTVDGIKRDLRRVLRAFAERTGTAGARTAHLCQRSAEPWSTQQLPIVAGARRGAEAGDRRAPAPIIRRPGADAVHLTAYGIPCVPFGPGGRLHPERGGASMHAFGEHVLLEDCVAAAKIYLAVALDICSRKAP